MSQLIDNFIPLRKRLNHHQYAGWTPTRYADDNLGCVLDSDVRIAMPDGVHLSADVYRPKIPGKYPAIVQVGAYNTELHAAGAPTGTNEVGSPPVITDRGYVQVMAARRGMGRSEGTSTSFASDQEIDDYVKVIEWASVQPWCSGDVCMFGTSYYGLLQPLVAARKPAALKAMFANEICTDFFRHLVYYGGSVNNRFFALWLGANFKEADFQRKVPPWLRAAVSHVVNRDWIWSELVHPRINDVYDKFMTMRPTKDMRALFASVLSARKTRSAMPLSEGVYNHLQDITIPFVVVQNQGQWNIHQFGAFDLFERAGTSPKDKYLIISEKEYELPVVSWQLEALAFFDHVVKRCDNGYNKQPHVRYWLSGANRFEGSEEFPPAEIAGTNATRTGAKWYLANGTLGNGEMVADAPSSGDASWVAVPRSTPLPDGMDEVMNQAIAYDFVCDRPITLAGPITLSLRFSCNEIDSYLVASLSRLTKEGKRELLTLGAIRPAQRSIDHERSQRFEIVINSDIVQPLIPDEPVNLVLSLVPMTAYFDSGETLRLEIASRTDLLRGSIDDGYVHFDMEVPPYFSRNVVHHGPDSFIELCCYTSK